MTVRQKTYTTKWSERFAFPLNAQVARFNASVRFDCRLAPYDIAASCAHVEMLAARKIIGAGDARKIIGGLRRIDQEVARGKFDWREADEDVHFNIERRLIELVGDVGKKMHTARSRNDQVATDLRLYLRDETDALSAALRDTRRAILALAKRHADTLMPGFTHLQVAQPIVFGHHMLAYDEMFRRDIGRLADARRRINVLPLGAGALAGVGYPIDRRMVARRLGFDGVCENSLDAVSDRDFAIEFAAAAAMMMMHLSRLCEELILWASPAFEFVRLSDTFCTGSSIMPQKKNPDIPELIRGKCARAIGDLTALLALMKSQPLAYNKDNQEDKEPLFDSADTARECAQIAPAMIEAIVVEEEAMRRLLERGYPTATELADYLTRRGVAFRDAHGIVSAIVRYAESRDVALGDLALSELRRYSDKIDDDAMAVLDAGNAVARRDHIGGAAPRQVQSQIRKRLKALGK